MSGGEGFDIFRRRGAADEMGHIEGVEIAGSDEAVDSFEVDVIGVDMPGFGPAGFLHGGGRGGLDAGRFGSDDEVFAIGFVPDGRDVDPLFGGLLKGMDLSFGLVGKAVAHAESELLDFHHISYSAYVIDLRLTRGIRHPRQGTAR